ncbi:hypothetical protein CVT24_009306 [Panaeolus cyanescens]|uniref:C2H2-type domain-containing protein n=1 Tax=Panaeolus cyanescens TaxID=181874 RepID=A0A409Y8M3_9AGAR|nr:hypothetical protein CVT24_009306 [Panaeolus cyanescens]
MAPFRYPQRDQDSISISRVKVEEETELERHDRLAANEPIDIFYDPWSDDPAQQDLYAQINFDQEMNPKLTVNGPPPLRYPPHVIAGYRFRRDERQEGSSSMSLLDRLHETTDEESYYRVLDEDLARPVVRPSPNLWSWNGLMSVNEGDHEAQAQALEAVALNPGEGTRSVSEDQGAVSRPKKRPKKEKSVSGAMVSQIKKKKEIRTRLSCRREWAKDERKIKLSEEIIQIMCRVRTGENHQVGQALEHAIKQAKKDIQQSKKRCDPHVQRWLSHAKNKQIAKVEGHVVCKEETLGDEPGRVWFVCVWCAERLSTSQDLADHVRGIHLDLHISFCDKCNAFSSPMSSLPKHDCIGDWHARTPRPASEKYSKILTFLGGMDSEHAELPAHTEYPALDKEFYPSVNDETKWLWPLHDPFGPEAIYPNSSIMCYIEGVYPELWAAYCDWYHDEPGTPRHAQ